MPIERGELARLIVEINKDLKPYGLQFVDDVDADGNAVYVLDDYNLRRCPFCGGRPKMVLVSETDGTYCVECGKCAAIASGIPTALPCSVEGAASDWNSRVINCRACPGPGGKKQEKNK